MSTLSRITRCLVAGAIGLCSVVAQAAPPVYRISLVPSLPGVFCQATAFNDVGQVAGQCDQRGYLWSATAGIQPIQDPLYPTATFYVTGINNHGVVIGYRFESWGSHAPAFVWSAASGFTYFGDSPRQWEPYAINDAGKVVGHSVQGGTTDYLWAAFEWTAGSGVRPLMPSNSVLRTLAYGVNESGQIAANFEKLSEDRVHAVRLEPGGGRTPVLPVPRRSSARAINDAGHVVGWLDNRRAVTRAYVWTPEAGARVIDARADLQVFSNANDIGAGGQVVGMFTIVDSSGDTWFRPLYWDEAHGMLDLAALVEPGDPLASDIVEYLPDGATAVNAQGQVLVTALSATTGLAQSYLFTPTP